MANKLYDEKSIESLSPLEFTRLRPGVYCGDTTYSTQLLVEIISNAVDEFRLGHGNKISVDVKDSVVIVEDSGQGFIPNSFRDDGKTILEAAFSVLNTSGKYREDGTYEGTSLGSFGIGSKTVYKSKDGLNDLVDDFVKDKEIINNRMSMTFSEGKNKMDMVLTYTSNYSSSIVPYVNTGLTEAGPHIIQIKTILTREFNKFFREKKWLKEKDENLTGDDIQEGMYLVFNITAPNISYDAQVKSRITKIDMTPFSRAIAENLQTWFAANEKEIKNIADKAINARKAREAAKKAKELIRNKQQKKEKALKFDSKLADCYSKNRSKCEIYITEGNSASGNLKTARDNEFQAVMPVRGKILNTQKATLDKIQKNAEIMTMIDAFGLSIDTKTMKITYKPEDLRYGKIIIMSDADVDGAHIKNLFYTFIWNFCP